MFFSPQSGCFMWTGRAFHPDSYIVQRRERDAATRLSKFIDIDESTQSTPRQHQHHYHCGSIHSINIIAIIMIVLNITIIVDQVHQQHQHQKSTPRALRSKLPEVENRRTSGLPVQVVDYLNMDNS